jgi:hypothetical protein
MENMSSLKRLEALETRLTGQELKERKFFINGICIDNQYDDLPMTLLDKHNKPLEGWHYVSVGQMLGVNIV